MTVSIDLKADDPAEVAWSALAAFTNLDELLDEIALASRDSVHGKIAYELFRRATRDAIETLDGRLWLIDARNARPGS